MLDSPYTRYPVYRGSLDEIVGILHVRDLIEAMHERGIAAVNLVEIVRQATMVPETKDLAALLTEFRRSNQHMAIVIDEYGAVEGIVTLEDLLEEIVGEIEDEFDLPDETVERVDEDTIRIDGTLTIDDFNEQFRSSTCPARTYHTVGGFSLRRARASGRAGRATRSSTTACVFQVDALVDGQRIDRLTVTFQPWHRTGGEVAGGAGAEQA